jgi:hypothetical protein
MTERFVLVFLSIGFCLPGPWAGFAIDCTSHVSFLRFRATDMFPKQVLMEFSGFAIWDGNKVIMAISTSAQTSENLRRSSQLLSNTKHSSVVHMPSDQSEVTVHTAHEEYLMSQTNHCASYPSSDAQPTDKPYELVIGDNVEGREGK